MIRAVSAKYDFNIGIKNFNYTEKKCHLKQAFIFNLMSAERLIN